MNNKGFTLIELLGVVTLLGILLIIAIPAMTRYSGKARNQAYDTMSKSLYEGAASKLMDDGKIIPKCEMDTRHNTEEEMKDNLKKDIVSCSSVSYTGASLVSGGYVEPLISPDRSGKSCEAEVKVIRVINPDNADDRDADDFYYRVWLKCPGRAMVNVYTTADADGDD